jgi:hypothetical protein
MSITLKQDNDQNVNIHNESDNVNNKIIVSMDRKDGSTTNNINIHNAIHNKFVIFVKDNKLMNMAYFKATFNVVFRDIFKTNLQWANIPTDIDIQINIKKILKDNSYLKVFNIIRYYSNESGKDLVDDKEAVDVTALFYSTLFQFVKRNYEI